MTNNANTIATIASICPSHDALSEVGTYIINLAECEGAEEPQWGDRVYNPGEAREVIEVGAVCPNPCAG